MIPANKRLIWAHGALPEFNNPNDRDGQLARWYLPLRVLHLLQIGARGDLIILPSHPGVREFANWVCDTTRLSGRQIIWTSGDRYSLHEDILFDERVMAQLRLKCSHPQDWIVIPYSAKEEAAVRWTKKLGLEMLQEPEKVIRLVGHKGFLHTSLQLRRNSGDSPGLATTSWVPLGIDVPPGFTCEDSATLMRAGVVLKNQGHDRTIIKPVHGSAGEGIEPVKSLLSLGDYRFPFGSPVALEAFLNIDTDAKGNEISKSVQGIGSNILGVTDQLVHNNAWHGNATPTSSEDSFTRRVLTMTHILIDKLVYKGLTSFWSLDFVSVEGKPLLIDPNFNRFGGGHPAQLLKALIAPEKAFVAWKSDTPAECSISELHQALLGRGLAFDRKTQKGITPICYLPGIYMMLIAFGDTRRDAERIRRQSSRVPVLA